MAHLKIALLFAACICCFNLTSPAQDLSGEVVVTVKDQFGGTVAGAEIVLTKPDRKVQTVRANSRGVAEFTRLPAGEYTVDASAEGFKEFKNRNLILRSGETQRIEIVLEIAPIESEVEIGENESVNAENTGAAVVLNENEIANLPDNQEELEKAIKRIGEAVTGEELPISVNGVQGGKIPPKEAIQQIRVNQNVFSAQYDGPFGGGIEIFTRASVDKYGGYVSFSFADARLNAADPFIGRRVPFQSRSYFFNVSGPLLGKKANFFVYASRSESDSSSVINAVILDPQFRPVEFKQSLATPNQAHNLFLNINADPTKKHKLYLGYSFSLSEAKNQNTGGFSLPSRANDSDSQSHFLQLSDTFLVNANIVNQTRLVAISSTNNSFGGSTESAVNVLDAFFGGGSQQNISNKTLRFDLNNETTWQMGRYALGFGFRFRGEYIDQNSANNFGGTYTFGGKLAPVLDANNNPVLDGGGSIVTEQISSLESYRRTLLFRQLGFTNERIRELGGGATQFTISGGDPAINVAQYDAGFYVQNSYKISETLAASFGARYEYQTNISSNFNLAPRFGFIWAPKAKKKRRRFTLCQE